ncbi:hypothetical protein [Arhodomonas sp. AD133]|uniref:hypothetical protein n=1 Tax=Arhodomonas sp. AD133 TaxID=3415009 RepID=UPI003EC0760A
MATPAMTYLILDDAGVLWQGRGPEAFEHGLALMRAFRLGEPLPEDHDLPRPVEGDLVFAQELDRNTPAEMAPRGR